MPHIVPRFGTLSPDLDVDKTSFGKGRQPQQLAALVNMSSSNTDNFPPPGLVVPAKGEPLDDMSELAHAILDDVFYNIIHDIVLQTHREEKIARASSAAIIVERKAAENDPNRDEDAVRQVHKAETDGAIFNNGEVYLKGNPLKTTDEIRCGKCGLPRLLHPTDGNGAKKADPSIEYCKRRPFIEKKGYDIYGQTFQPEGPGRGKKKQPNPLTNPSNQDSPGSEPQDTSKPINFPHAKCHNCATFLPIKRMNNHMAKCIGGGGRDSSRNALLKIQNGNSNGSGSQYGSTPPGSRNGTPVPASQTSKGKTSPNKRDAEDYDSDESPEKKKKKIIKKVSSNAALAKANKLKAPKMAKSASQHSSSNLSFEQRVPTSDDDSEDGEYGTVVVEPKKKNPIKIKAAATTNSAKNGDALKRKKWLHGRGGGGIKLENNSTPVIEPPDKEKKSAVTSNGNAKKERAASESSQTLSSPN